MRNKIETLAGSAEMDTPIQTHLRRLRCGNKGNAQQQFGDDDYDVNDVD